jgi:hypothetical protein
LYKSVAVESDAVVSAERGPLTCENLSFGCLLKVDGNVDAGVTDLDDFSSAYQILSGLGGCIYNFTN